MRDSPSKPGFGAVPDCFGECPLNRAHAHVIRFLFPLPFAKKLNGYLAIDHPTKPLRLSLHMGIGCGELTAVHVGGVFKVSFDPPVRLHNTCHFMSDVSCTRSLHPTECHHSCCL